MSNFDNFPSNSEDLIEAEQLQESQASVSNNSFENFLSSPTDLSESAHLQELQTSVTTNITGFLAATA